MKVNHTITNNQRRKNRVRRKIMTGSLPRLHVYRSNKHISLQLIDDQKGKTVAGYSELQKTVRDQLKGKPKMERAKLIAEKMGQALKDLGITNVVFDRGAYRYHGRVKAIAEALRSTGIHC